MKEKQEALTALRKQINSLRVDKNSSSKLQALANNLAAVSDCATCKGQGVVQRVAFTNNLCKHSDDYECECNWGYPDGYDDCPACGGLEASP